MKGHIDADARAKLTFKEGDELAHALHAQTTDRIVIGAANGRFLPSCGSPAGRARFWRTGAVDGGYRGGGRYRHPARRADRGENSGRVLQRSRLLVQGTDLVAETRKGKQVMNLKPGSRMLVARDVPRRA